MKKTLCISFLSLYVFCPNLLADLEKKNMEEIKMFIKSEADVQKFKKAILDNQGKLISIDLEYCMDDRADTDGNKIGWLNLSNFKTLPENSEQSLIISGITIKEKTLIENGRLKQGMAVIYNPTIEDDSDLITNGYASGLPENLDGGALILSNSEEFIPHFIVNIPYETKSKYKWDTDVDDKYDNCNSSEFNINHIRYYQHLKGIFFVSDEPEVLYANSEEEINKIIELEPISKKDLAIKGCY